MSTGKQLTVAAVLTVLGIGAAVGGVALGQWVNSRDDSPSAAATSEAPSPSDAPSPSEGTSPTESAPTVDGAPRGATADFGIRIDAAQLGGTPGDSPVEVVVTEDFQCPFCGQFEQENGELLEGLVKDGSIVLDLRPVTFLDTASRNEYSSRAANAALCVLDQDGPAAYWRMHGALYADQPAEGSEGPDDADLVRVAGSIGTTDIESCVETKAFADWLDDAIEHAQGEGFSGTPWVRVDGSVVDSDQDSLRRAIEAAADQPSGTSI